MSTHWVLTTEGYPPERHKVLVALRVEDGQQIDLIALGYMRYAGGVKECPFFVTPSGRGVAYAWCDCLPAEMTTARFGAPVFFKPSIAEVCAQLRDANVPEGVTHYWVDSERVGFHLQAGKTYHTAVVTLWRMS